MLGVEEMANRLVADRNALPVGKRWAINFVKRQPDLKTRFQRRYDYQRAKCEDPTVIRNWFRLVQNTIAKYGIRIDDIYNFDETGFMMGMISTGIVVISAERHERQNQYSLEIGNGLQSFKRSMRKAGRSSRSLWLQANITFVTGMKEATSRAIGLLPRPKMAGQMTRRASSG